MDTYSAPSHQKLIGALWPADEPEALRTWAILDAAREPRVLEELEYTLHDKHCLFAGQLSPALQNAAPYLIQIDSGDRFTQSLLQYGWGQAWGIFFRTRAWVDPLRKHFRTFLRVRDYRGKYLLFRYYDPRVLRAYLPTCLPDELSAVFGPVHSFLLEAQDSNTVLRYRFDGQKLVQSAISL